MAIKSVLSMAFTRRTWRAIFNNDPNDVRNTFVPVFALVEYTPASGGGFHAVPMVLGSDGKTFEFAADQAGFTGLAFVDNLTYVRPIADYVAEFTNAGKNRRVQVFGVDSLGVHVPYVIADDLKTLVPAASVVGFVRLRSAA